MNCKTCGQQLPPILDLLKQREEDYMQWLEDRINNPDLAPLPWMRSKPITYRDLFSPHSKEELQRRIDVVNKARLG